jgi:pilus assembly protein CpaE
MSGRNSYSSNASDNVMHAEFMAFVTDEDSQIVTRGWSERQGLPQACVQSGGPDMFASMLESSPPPKMALVDIDGQADPVAVAGRLISLCGADTKVVAIGSPNDVGLYRRMLGVGVIDYLVKPLSPELLNTALASALRGNKAGKSEIKEARIVVILGIRGGVGASTIAVNTSWVIAHQMDATCALLDLDMQFGTTSLSLDLEPGHGLRDIVSSPQRVDGLMIASSMVAESERFSVLGGEEAVDEYIPVDSAAIAALVKEVKCNFDYIVVDLPRHMLASQKRLLASAHDIILVSEMSLAGIRDTLRIKSALTGLGFTARILVVASKATKDRGGQVDIPTFEKGAQVKVDLVIPEDHKIVAQASNSGKALAEISKTAPVAKAITALAQMLGTPEQIDTRTKNIINHMTGLMRGKFAKKKGGAS